MCLIIHAEPKFRISKALMADFAERNDDGFGVMWIDNNRINAEKFGPTEMDKLYPMYERLQDKEHFIHLRMRTHGATSAEMSHPYYAGYGIWLMHNGVLGELQGEDKTKSDTWYLIEDVLKPLFAKASNPHDLIRSKAFGRMFNRFLGGSNRIVMGDRGGYVIFNESTWHEIDNEKTGVKGLLVSNMYAWSCNSYGQPKVEYTSNHGYYRGGQQNLPLTTTTGGSGSGTTGTASNESSLFEQAINKFFFQLSRKWYVDKFGIPYKREGYAMKRREDLQDKDQFWNTFSADVNINAGQWMAEQNNVEVGEPVSASETPPKIITPETIDPKAGTLPTLVINWASMSEEDIRKHIETHPAVAAQAIHQLTHNRQ